MDSDSEKRLAAQAAVELVEDGMVLGLGTGSTAVFFVQLLGDKVKQGLKVRGVPTSDSTAQLAKSLNIPLVTLDEFTQLDMDVDGADEVDTSLCLIKGGGGALLREKIVASAAKRVVIIVDEKKLVQRLGKFHLPVEVIPFASALVQQRIEEMGASSVVRKKGGSIFRTDENNIILDCDFGFIDEPKSLAQQLSLLPGIVEHGLFVGMADEVIVGAGDSVKKLFKS